MDYDEAFDAEECVVLHKIGHDYEFLAKDLKTWTRDWVQAAHMPRIEATKLRRELDKDDFDVRVAGVTTDA